MIWRRWGADAALMVLAVAVAASVWGAGAPHRAAVAVTAAASILVLLGRRVAPLTVGLLSFALLVAGMALSPMSTGLQFVGMIAAFATVGSAVRGVRLAACAGAGLVVVGTGTLVISTGGGWPDFWLSAFICEGALGLGALVSRRGHRIDRLAAEVALADALAAQRTSEALAEERARIARELHDVVSHGLSVVVVQTQAARGVLADAPSSVPAAVGRHLDAVESSARDALAEMRRMLGLLQLDGPTPAVPDPPSPGLDDLPALVDRARSAGLPVEAELPTTEVELGAGLALAVYRIVQESLTNVLKHAPGAPTRLWVAVDRGRVTVDVVSGPAVTSHARPGEESGGVGHGLLGMRERAQMYGGRLTAEVGPGGTFRVHAQIPVARSITRVRR
jgi:signal transduction histidine kinase